MHWYDSKSMNKPLNNPNSENEDSSSRFYNTKTSSDPLTSYEIKRQPLSQRHGNEPLRNSSTDRIHKKDSKQLSKKAVYNPGVLNIENEFFNAEGTQPTNPTKTEKSTSQSDRYEKKPSTRPEKQDTLQRLGLITPSPSPPRSHLNPKDQEFSNRFETNYQENSRPFYQKFSEPTGFPHQPDEDSFRPQNERGRPIFPHHRNQTQMPFRHVSNGPQQPIRRTSVGRTQAPVKKPPRSSVGDWTCTGCKNINFARRINCNVCDMPKPYFEILKTPISQIGPQGLFKDTDWQCFNCRNINFQKRENCNICNEPKPEEYVQRDLQMRQVQNGPRNWKNGGNKPQQNQNNFKKPNYGNSKMGRLTTQGKYPNLQQKRYSYSNNGGNVGNGVPFNQRPIQRERSRSFLKK